jgi:hypothetical protein
MTNLKMTFPYGSSIQFAAKSLVEEANATGKTVETEFNCCTLIVTPDTVTAASVVNKYRLLISEASREFKASPAGQKIQADREEYDRHLCRSCEPGLTIYTYDLDNTNGTWKRVPKEVVPCFELWDGTISIDACIGEVPSTWPEAAKLSGKDSPDRRFT